MVKLYTLHQVFFTRDLIVDPDRDSKFYQGGDGNCQTWHNKEFLFTIQNLQLKKALSFTYPEFPVFLWNENLWLDVYMDQLHGFEYCFGRVWVPLSEFYRPIGKAFIEYLHFKFQP